MRICIISSGRSPFDERIFYKTACSLRKVYPSITIISPYIKSADHINGIKIIGIPSRKGRWNRFSVWKELYRQGTRLGADVYQCEELDSWFIGWMLKKRLKSKLIFDAHECNIAAIPQGLPTIIQSLVTVAVFFLEKFLIKRTDHIFVANQIVRAYYYLLNKFAQVSILYNVPVLRLFKENKYPEEDKYDLCHEGHLNFGRGLKIIMNVLSRLKIKYPKIRLLVVGDIYGDERKWLNKKILEDNLADNIVITGWLDYKDVGKEIAKCRIGLIAMLTLPNNMLAGHPNKLFNYMRYGLAVVGPKFPEIDRVISEEKCGITFIPNNEDELFSAIDYMLVHKTQREEMGERGKKSVHEKYSWEKMEKTLFEAYMRVKNSFINIESNDKDNVSKYLCL